MLMHHLPGPSTLTIEYHYGIVAISIAIATIGSFVAYDICLRARSSAGAMRSVWLAGAAVAAGGSIWSMHFIGMLAVRMPMDVTYDFWWTFLSLVLPIILTGAGLRLVVVYPQSVAALLVGGFIMGSGIIVMHYVGMAAMRMDATVSHDPFLVGLSVALAVVLSTAALFIAFKPARSLPLAAAGAIVMGVAVSSMHYTAMAASRISMVPDMDDTGQAPIPVSLLAFSIFITLSTAMLLVLMASRVDRRNAEALARQARVTNDTTERYQTLLRHSFDLIAPLDAEGRFVDEAVSSDRLLGYEPGELMGKRFTDLVSAGERADAQAWLAAVLLSDRPLNREYSFLSRAGGEIPCECNAVRAEAQGTAWSLIVNVRDLTEKRQMEAMLGQSQRLEALGRMSSGMAHDFSNLITAVSLNLESVERRLPSSDLLEHLRASQTALSHGNSLIRQLLAFARQQKVEPEPINLNSAVESMDRFIQMSLSAEIAVELDLADGLWPCTADRGMLEAALLNLVVNAQDAMPDGGKLTIATANESIKGRNSDLPPGDYVVLSLTDTGKGMSRDIASRAAEPFFTTKGAGQGTGLGLSMVFGFAQQFAGDMRIASAEGHGTTVQIRLPRSHALPVERTRETASDAGGHLTILLVDDDNAVRHAAAIFLREKGFTVIDAANAEEALLVPDLRSVDLLITDIHMGRINGLELAHRLSGRNPALGVILTSGSGSTRLETSARWRHLRKPYTVRELLREAMALVEARRTAAPPVRNFLIVDHDAASAERVAGLIGNAGFGDSVLASSLGEARKRAAEYQPAVALVGIAGSRNPGSGDLDGIEAGRRLHEEFGMRIVLVADSISAVPADYPVDGFLVRSFTLEQLSNVLKSALDAA
jgi:PAS domain S-box-containing protein